MKFAMDQMVVRAVAVRTVFSPSDSLPEELQTELVRKSIHMLIALVPTLASVFGVGSTLALLSAGTLFYTYCEMLRLEGGSVAVISSVTSVAARSRDIGRFTLGPVTLGIGAMVTLLLYPDPAASIGIYALAFGDGLASLFGKFAGRLVIPRTGGKTVEGTLACFSAVFVSVLALTGRPVESGAVATSAAVLELAPTADLDNLILPIGTGLVAALVFL
jgi:phytol kinase